MKGKALAIEAAGRHRQQNGRRAHKRHHFNAQRMRRTNQ